MTELNQKGFKYKNNKHETIGKSKYHIDGLMFAYQSFIKGDIGSRDKVYRAIHDLAKRLCPQKLKSCDCIGNIQLMEG